MFFHLGRFSRETVFTGIVGSFVAFFVLFAAVIYPNQALAWHLA